MPQVITGVVVASAARTTSGNSAAISTLVPSTSVGVINLAVHVTAVSGTTPSMTLTVQWSDDGTTFGNADTTADTFAAITATTDVFKQFPARAPFFRLSWAITGTTPSFTFSVNSDWVS